MRRWTLVLAAAVVGSALSACSDGASDGTAVTNKLTVVAFKGGGTELAGMPELNAAFEKANPDIDLEYKYVSPDYDAYNNSRLAAGDAADVLMVDRQKVVKWVKQGYLMDLSDQPWVSRMNSDLEYFTSIKGKTYQLAGENIAIGLYANLTLLKSAGINSVPKTWPEFMSALQALKARKISGLMLANKGGWTGEQLALALAANVVEKGWAEKYDASGSSFAGSWGPVIDRIKALFSADVVDPKLMLGLDPNNDGMPQFKSGKWAFAINGAWALKDVAQSAKFDFSLNAFPGGEAGTPPKTFTFVGAGWAVNSRAKNPEAAKKYVDFMSKPANSSVMLKAEAAFSTLKDVETPDVPHARPAIESFKAGNSIPSPAQILNFSDAETELQKGIEAVFANPGTPTERIVKALDSQIPKTPIK